MLLTRDDAVYPARFLLVPLLLYRRGPGGFCGLETLRNTQRPISILLSRDPKGRGFRFSGTQTRHKPETIMTTLVAESAVTPTPSTLLTERIVLTGFMGAGKSTVGRLLAAQLSWNFLDVDTEIERLSGVTIEEIFATHGEAEFRRRESTAIARSLGARNTVIALGGGAPEEITNRLLLEQTPNTTVVFLDAPFSVLFDRCVLQEGAAVRPNLQDPDAAAARFQRRIPHYIRCSSHRIVTENLSIEQTVAAIRAQLL